tara:strand:- start:305 stop:985 length:681 start_codon:yes stop_codon:yes gene_type:complete
MSAEDIAKRALDIRAVTLDPKGFGKPGRLKPVHYNMDYFMGTPADRKLVYDEFASMGLEGYDGFATTSDYVLPVVSRLADDLEKDLLLLKDAEKVRNFNSLGYGLRGCSDLDAWRDKNFALIEDRVVRGAALARAVCTLRVKRLGGGSLFSIFDFGFPRAREMFKGVVPYNREGHKLDYPVSVKSIFNLDHVLDIARERDVIDDAGRDSIRLWRDDSSEWNKRYDS